MPLEARFQEGPRNHIRLVSQQLRLDAMNSRRLLKGLDHMGQQVDFDLAGIGQTSSVGDVEVADHSLAAFVYKKRITKHAATVDGGVTRQDLRVDVAEDHFGRTGVVPGKQARPKLRLVIEKGAQIQGKKVPEVEDFQRAPAAACA